jgi:hypothetical protein
MCIQKSHGEILREIKKKKDELYDLTTEGMYNARTSTLSNAWLLLHLYEEVTPRPHDPNWYYIK